MKRRPSSLPCLLLVACALAPPGGVHAADERAMVRAPLESAALRPLVAELGEAAADAVDTRRAAGLGLALVVDGEVRWIDAWGLRERGRRDAYTTTTPFPVGELTRLHTVAMAMALVEAGKLDLDAPIGQYLPGFVLRSRFADAPPVRVRDLMSHHGGLPYARLADSFQSADAPRRPLNWDEVGYLAQPTRSVQVVSNIGYELLGRVLEGAAGQSLEAVLADTVATPLALAATGYALPADAAPGHRKGRAEPRLVARDRAAQGVVASLADLAAVVAALMPGAANRSPWDAASRDEIFRVHNADVPFDFGNGAGLGVNLSTSVRPGLGRVASLFTGFPGYSAEIRYALDHGIAVVAVANWDEGGEALSDLAVDAFDGLLTLRSDIPPRERDRPLPDAVPWPEGVRAAQPAARYATPTGLADVIVRDNGFRIEALDLAFRAEPREDGWFSLRYDLLGVIPIGFSGLNRVVVAPATVDGRGVMLAYSRDRWFLVGAAWSPDPEASRPWERWTGRWRLTNPDRLTEQLELEEIELTLRDGVLAIEYTVPFVIDLVPRVPLEPVGDGRFVVAGLGANTGEEVRIDTSVDPPRLYYSGYVLERVGER
jgi:CubicO group peptidase (beta-lactamase class C family)